MLTRGVGYWTCEITIPVEEVAYAACSRPTQNAQPEGQPDLGSKCPKIYPAELRPLRAMAKTQTTIATRPANVQKIAKVYRGVRLPSHIVQSGRACLYQGEEASGSLERR